MRRLLAPTLAFIALATVALPFSQEPWPELVLKGGEGVAVPDTGVTLLLTGITDQRCPPDVDCYWEGMIRAEITVTGPKPELQQIVICNLCDDGERAASAAGVTVTLVGLVPSTKELAALGREPVLTDYELTLAYDPVH